MMQFDARQSRVVPPRATRSAAGATIRGSTLVVMLVLLLTGQAFGQSQLPCKFDVAILPQVDCGLFSGPGTPVAINSNGTVLGRFGNCAGTGDDSYIWNPGDAQLTIIPRPAWMTGFAAADLNDNGLICGTASTTTAYQRAYIFDLNSGQWTELPPPVPESEQWSGARALNNAGQVVGWRTVDDGGDPVYPYQAFLYDPKLGIQDLGVVNGPRSNAVAISEDGQTIVGWTGEEILEPDSRGVIWKNEVPSILPVVVGGISSAAMDFNQHGDIVLWGRTQLAPRAGSRSSLLRQGSLIALGFLPGFNSTEVQGITEDGIVFGNTSNPGADAFFWHDGVMENANGFLNSAENLDITWLFDVNAGDQFVGRGKIGITNVAFVLTPRPRAGDTNCDEVVDVNDLLNLVGSWGPCAACAADFNGDHHVDTNDLILMLTNWS